MPGGPPKPHCSQRRVTGPTKSWPHLTTARKAGDGDPAKAWDFKQASTELRQVIAVFLKEPIPTVSANVRQMLNRI